MQTSTPLKVDNLQVTGVSRSGRVRKKSSKLLEFLSPNNLMQYDSRAYKRPLPVKTTPSSALATTSSSTPLTTTNNKKSVPLPPQISSIDLAQQIQQSPPPNINIEQNKNILGNASTDVNPSADGQTNISAEINDVLRMDDSDDNDDDDEPQLQIDTTVRKSAYMTEKSSKKKMIKDGKVVMARPQRKDKGKSRFTAYMLWAKDVRQEMMLTYPDLDFSTASRRLGEMWANVPSNEKYNWRRRAKRLAMKGKDKEPDKLWQKPASQTSKFLNRNATAARLTKKQQQQQQNQQQQQKSRAKEKSASPNVVAQDLFATQTSSLPKISTTATPHFKVTGTSPLDAAAHLKLLGESLTIIGSRLKEHEGQITVSGSLSVLLDSLLCSVVPLMCLAPCIPIVGTDLAEIKDKMANTLDNIAYVMPGL